ncbi:hypothetical protein FIU88_09280 [Halomonas sp. THAF12]|nr:hypothetical protein FIU88_09280 [Halomonas sp. THAF12]
MNQVLRLTHRSVEQHSLPRARPMGHGQRQASRFLTRSHPHRRLAVGCLAHTPHDVLGLVDLANAERRRDFYSRWYGLTEPRLKIWKAC